MRKEFCEKDGILITYTDSDVCFEDCRTAGYKIYFWSNEKDEPIHFHEEVKFYE